MSGGKTVDWSQWSEPQLRCLLALDFAVPRHQTHLSWLGVRGPTVRSLEHAGLVRRHRLFEKGREDLPMPFLTLSQAGEAVKRDYVNWHRRVLKEVGSLPPAMLAIAETRI